MKQQHLNDSVFKSSSDYTNKMFSQSQKIGLKFSVQISHKSLKVHNNLCIEYVQEWIIDIRKEQENDDDDDYQSLSNGNLSDMKTESI